jgi:hypothetical protein
MSLGMESIEKLLKTSFAGAANQLTQLYVTSLQQQKHSYLAGYNAAMEIVIDFVRDSNSGVIRADTLLEFIRKETHKAHSPTAYSTSTNTSNTTTNMSTSTTHNNVIPTFNMTTTTNTPNTSITNIGNINNTICTNTNSQNVPDNPSRPSQTRHEAFSRIPQSPISSTPPHSAFSFQAPSAAPKTHFHTALPNSPSSCIFGSTQNPAQNLAQNHESTSHIALNPFTPPSVSAFPFPSFQPLDQSSTNFNLHTLPSGASPKKRQMDFTVPSTPNELWDQLLKKVKIDL